MATFLLSIPLFTGFDYANAGLQFIERREWIPAYDIQYHLGADGISIALILLTTITSVLVLIGAWGSVSKRVSQYFATLLILEGVMIGVFCAVDSILFYAFFEGMLIPMFIIIGVRSEEHTSELQSLMRISYAVFCLKKKKNIQQ